MIRPPGRKGEEGERLGGAGELCSAWDTLKCHFLCFQLFTEDSIKSCQDSLRRTNHSQLFLLGSRSQRDWVLLSYLQAVPETKN